MQRAELAVILRRPQRVNRMTYEEAVAILGREVTAQLQTPPSEPLTRAQIDLIIGLITSDEEQYP